MIRIKMWVSRLNSLPTSHAMPAEWKYEIVSGFFVQDAPTGPSSSIGPTPEFFGLVSESWSQFVAEIDKLGFNSSESTSYKVLFLGRHGEGNHNVAEIKYGQKAWDEKWALLEGDGELTWGPDPHLTVIGEEQARNAHDAWKREVVRGAPVPQRFYCSPLTRAIRTFELTFKDVLPVHLQPIIVENCREEYGEHTCDSRRTRSEIQCDFPDFTFEEGFEEQDVLWSPERETKASVERRARLVLDRIFETDRDDTYISITTHSGWINAVLRVIGRGNYALPTGGLIVVVVKGSFLNG
ncbi:histidine phosphatase superfamily [Multifurca ochricompacta]|uniref:Histidine phosphatase superfamily n=1 Tax=Multifurca ochricompacta TaxID=376703 RepID=A0AAD4QTH9_9AGAM|nr:histidine phosphatase superfamily [Multifurca ochricompacta]